MVQDLEKQVDLLSEVVTKMLTREQKLMEVVMQVTELVGDMNARILTLEAKHKRE